MSDRKAQLEAESSDTAGDLTTWRSFMDHAGWKRLSLLIQGQINSRDEELGAPLASMDQTLHQEFIKGERAFGKLILKMPQLAMEESQRRLDEIQQEMDDETSVDTGSGSGESAEQRELLDERNDAFGDDADK